MSSGLMHYTSPYVNASASGRATNTTHHYLREDRAHKVLRGAPAGEAHDEHHPSRSVRQRGLDEHRRDRDVCRGVLRARVPLCAVAHVDESADEQECEQRGERDGGGEVGDGEAGEVSV